ncbi:formate/nitrite transporter family protein [Frigidibacter sp. MR17.24]|uniref:formate/nitrite transporter family protein n=1 Tax=Frigidibacter sp. MR17.24 TaxID=3127345 RepID=UPI003012A994
MHEVIRRDGDKELNREVMALLWSAVAGGITMSTSFMARGILRANLPETDFGFLFEAMGYTVGFLFVIAANQQLFTENTVTAVLPFMTRPDRRNLMRLLRLWGVVLAGNTLGGLIAAAVFAFMPVFPPDVGEAFVEIGHHLVEKPALQMLGGGIISGWLIATMVWAIYATGQAKLAIIFLATYLIAIGDFPHVIVGTVEVLHLLMLGETATGAAIFRFWLPVLAGNVIGGTLIFALISHAQVRADHDSGTDEDATAGR